jgi:hypothetical protein
MTLGVVPHRDKRTRETGSYRSAAQALRGLPGYPWTGMPFPAASSAYQRALSFGVRSSVS